LPTAPKKSANYTPKGVVKVSPAAPKK